jgi:hypothetical protein
MMSVPLPWYSQHYKAAEHNWKKGPHALRHPMGSEDYELRAEVKIWS